MPNGKSIFAAFIVGGYKFSVISNTIFGTMSATGNRYSTIAGN